MAMPTDPVSMRLPAAKFVSKKPQRATESSKLLIGSQNRDSSTGKDLLEGKQVQQISCLPVIVEFRRLLQSAKHKTEVVPGVSNAELLHTVVGLYDTCLPDITPQVLYATVTGKWAKTLILVRNSRDVAAEWKEKILKRDKEVQATRREKANGAPDAPQCSGEVPEQARPVATQTGLCTEQAPVTGESEKESAFQRLLNADKDTTQAEDAEEEQDGKETASVAKGDGAVEDILEEEEQRKVFAEVFSDSDSEEEEESDDDEEEEDFSRGINEFLKLVKQRKERREELGVASSLEEVEAAVGIESRIVGCATWEKSHIRPGEKIVQIDLLGVRRRHRKCGVGRYLLRQLKDTSVVGPLDSLVVYADHSAVDFFSLHGFSDDIVLNSKYSDLADNWTNCTLMCYIPPYVDATLLRETDFGLDLRVMELELQKWTEKSREAYQAQVACIMKLRHEVIALRVLVSSQKGLIQSLSEELEAVQTDKLMLEKSNLEHRIAAIKAGYYRRHYGGDDEREDDDGAKTNGIMKTAPPKSVGVEARQDGEEGDDEEEEEDEDEDGYDEDDEGEEDEEEEEEEEIDTEALIKALEAETRSLGGRRQSFNDRGDGEGPEIAAKFEAEMIDQPTPGFRSTVTKVTMANPTPTIQELYEIRRKQLGDPSIFTRLYFCGSLQRPERIAKILTNGFSEEDLMYGEFGVGLYFSEHPWTAAHFSALGKMVVAEVGLGRTQSIVKSERTAVTAPMGFDSIVTPGRLMLKSSRSGDGAQHETSNQEYVIYDPLQVIPVCLIEYTTVQGGESVRL